MSDLRADKTATGLPRRPIVVAHSSDLHIDDEARPTGYDGLMGLACVLDTANDAGADLVLLAGDTFDNGRIAPAIARRAGEILATARVPVVLLPGNHDPAGAESMFHRSGIVDVPHAKVIGLTAPPSIVFEHLDLEIVGRPHVSYFDMDPLPESGPRRARWQIVLAHGHYVAPEDWEDEAHRSWLISSAALAATRADYVALGHWDRPTPVGNGAVQAYYSGSPDLARTLNIVRLDAATGVSVERVAMRLPIPPR